MKYWWASYADDAHIKMLGPWIHDNSVAPFNAWKKLRKDCEFIVFPSNTYEDHIALQEATHIWNTPDLKEQFLLSSVKSNLTKSITEEATAASVYRQRKVTADLKTSSYMKRQHPRKTDIEKNSVRDWKNLTVTKQKLNTTP